MRRFPCPTARCLLLILLLCSCPPVHGQTVKLQGQIRDITGAVLPNARVLLIDLTTLEIQRTASDSTGEFEFNGLNRTPYELKAACPGFVTGSAKVLERVDKVGFTDPNPPPTITVKVKITLTVRSAN